MDTRSNIEQEAAEWIIRRDRGEGAEDRVAFESWLSADVRHRQAFLTLQQRWQQADGLKSWRPYQGVLDAKILKRYAAPHNRNSTARYAAVVVIGILVAILLMLRHSKSPVVYATDVGGYQRVILHDGSILQLNTNTRVQVQLGAHRRQVRLLRGEAYFTVAPDPERPFEVFAANMAVRALATQFTVRMRDSGAVDILVTEGRVALRSSAAESQTTTASRDLPTLAAGEAAMAQRASIVVNRLPQAETARRLSWQAGELSFKGETLDQVVAEFNRYNRRKLVIEDPELNTLQVGGNFQATDLESFTKALERSLDVNATEDAKMIRLSRRRAQ
jgi:transmembrane sensor